MKAKLFGQEEITQRVAELGREVSDRYRGEEVVIVCVLKGAFMFFADLARHLDFEPIVDFVRLSSYADATSRGEKMLFTKDIEVDVEGKHVLIIEDIVDTGYSVEYLTEIMKARHPKSVAVCVLLDKTERREVDIGSVEFVGFKIESGFVVGYGIDYAEKFRCLPEIYEYQ